MRNRLLGTFPFLFLFLFLFLAAGAWLALRSEPAAAPDVVLITVDTLRADRLGCYGAATRTPFSPTNQSADISTATKARKKRRITFYILFYPRNTPI